MGHQMEKGNMYHLLTEMKETMNSLKTLASDTSSKEILNFLKEESQRQAARNDTFLKIMAASVQHLLLLVTSLVIPMSEPRNQFRYGMTNFRPNSSMVVHQGNMPQDLSGSEQEMSFMQQMNNPNFP